MRQWLLIVVAGCVMTVCFGCKKSDAQARRTFDANVDGGSSVLALRPDSRLLADQTAVSAAYKAMMEANTASAETKPAGETTGTGTSTTPPEAPATQPATSPAEPKPADAKTDKPDAAKSDNKPAAKEE
jgi:hypothetical protein